MNANTTVPNTQHFAGTTSSIRERMYVMVLSVISALLLLTAHGINDVATFETDSFTLAVGADGRTDCFIDRRSGVDYYDGEPGAPFAVIRTGAGTFPSTSAAYAGGQLTLGFDGVDGRVVFRVAQASKRLEFEVVSFDCDSADVLVFATIPLTLKGSLEEPFGVSPLALNLNTNCEQIPGLCPGLNGFIAYKRFGFVGARGAIVAAPMNELRDALKEAARVSDIAHSPLGGPWALDAPVNQGSYLIAVDEPVTEDNVGKWIDAARCAGATQIDLHGGHAFRWGDFEVNKDVYPRGRDSLRAVVDAIHDAGFAAGLHSYAFFIAKDTPWVTPVPDSRLAADAAFTLAGDVDEYDAAITVVESTEAMSAVTGFQTRNSATLRLGDELIIFTGVEKEPPFAFTGCVRGAYGTHAESHPQGSKAEHLKECFGLFVPQEDSSLFPEVAQRTADLYNACGFDMLYLDALDGADILAGHENAWHYSAMFVDRLVRHLQRPAVMEMSTFSHHLWYARSRMQAWDCPARGAKDFVDCHVLHNMQWKAAFLPTHLGWWGCFGWNGVQPERTLPDDMEYVCAKALATDSSLSYIVGFSPKYLERGDGQRLAAIARRYEELRRTGAAPDSIKARLAAPGQDFTLDMTDDGRWQFRPVAYSKHSITVGDGSERLAFTNPYSAQSLQLRIEAPLSAEAYDSPDSKVLADWNNIDEFGQAETQTGVTASLEQTQESGNKNESMAALSAQNTHVESDRAWAAFRKDFAVPLDLQNMGLGLWVVGDGEGEVLNVQLRSPVHLGGGIADHYIHVDFTGRRYFQLVEPESEALGDYEWAHTRRRSDMLGNPTGITAFAYPMYHIWVNYSQIASLTVGVNNVPAGKPVRMGIGPIKALPLSTKKLVNPSVTLGEHTLVFPVELDSGSYLELLAPDNCRVYDAHGECIGDVLPIGQIPVIGTGKNVAEFDCASPTGGSARAKLTVMMYGEPLCP